MAGAREHFRDAYGFEVKKEYQELHTKYTPLWDKEEAERGQRWADFLHTFEGGAPEDARAGGEEGEAALEAALRQLQASGANKEDFPWWQQLRILVQAGLPMALRGRLWRAFLQADSLQEPGVYEALVCQALAPQYQNSRKLTDPMPRVGSFSAAGAAEEGAQRQADGAAPLQHAERGRSIPGQAPVYQGGAQDWTVQIEKDLHRTFPGHPVMDRSGRRSLRRILAAYACRNPAVGYCQGMNFVAGCLLLFMAEEDAFWCLCAIVERLLAGYFSEHMVAPQVDQLVLKALADAHFPRLARHLGALAVDVASVSTQWFLCLFVNSLPLESCLRVWDLVFFERCASVLFRVALALVDIYAQALVATVDAVDAFSLLQNMAPLSFDSSRLVDVACIAYAHVDAGCLAEARARHEAAVSAQVQERAARKLELQRARLAAASAAAGEAGGEAAARADCLTATARSLPRIQVCLPNSAEPFSWDPADAQLHLDSSKAAATAYKIASSPAVDPDTGRRERAPPAARANGRARAAAASEIEPDEPPRAALDAELMDEVADVLDRRREELLREGGEAERGAAVAQLMGLVARLEGEMFQVEARRFEAENKAASAQMEIDLLRERIAAAEASTAERRTELGALRERQASEARDVEAGGRRCLQYSNSLRGAEANRALRASLLSEKQELIDGLQQELGQTQPRPGSRLLQKLGLGGGRK